VHRYGADVTSGGANPGAAVKAAADFNSIDHAPAHVVPGDTRRRQQRLAEITELIHVASLLHGGTPPVHVDSP
jgi:geranylgeranyl pyrophosphate synthase